MVATMTPVATGARARGPKAIRMPTATPEAGQKTATPSNSVRRTRPNRATEKIGDGGEDAYGDRLRQGRPDSGRPFAGCLRRAFPAHLTSDRPSQLQRQCASHGGARKRQDLARVELPY